ncbi:hypothetical protein ILT44_20270 [Microvirga sp. BT689]|uniref:hypothetical protein n=1 Tax=Microvirga arvi TaxID=2778731 RepID=UPI00194F6E01|nr:hypothetical protein [Microvirga arvi]MBM6582544.1 hypothetical protein [Microvirga arvi]
MSKSHIRAKGRRSASTPVTGLALARGEDQEAYKALRQAITTDLQPCDAIEAILTQTIIDRAWDTLRCRMIEKCLLASPSTTSENAAPNRNGTKNSLVRKQSGRQSAQEPALRRRGARAAPSDEDRAAAREALVSAYQTHSIPLEVLTRICARAEAQRDAAIQDLERYRSSVQRRRTHEIEDAEFTEVTGDGVKPETGGQPAQRTEQHRSPQSRRARPRKPQRA